MKRRTQLSLIGVLALVVSCALGCGATLNGKVVSSSTGEPVAGAIVDLAGKSAVTDGAGKFTIEGLEGEDLEGTVSLEGFEQQAFTPDLEGDNRPLVLEIPDCTVVVSVVEKAVEPVEVANMTVTLDGTAVKTTPPAFRRVPPGDHTLTVTCADHEPYESTVKLTAGESTLTAELSLTPLETYRRFLETGLYNRNDAAYAYIHPDEQELLTLERYIGFNAALQMKSYTLGSVRMLESWKSEWTGETYTNVAEIDRSIEYQVIDPKYSDYGLVFTKNGNQHWVQVDGIWRIVYPEEF